MKLLYLLLLGFFLDSVFAEVLIPVQITPEVKTINTQTTYTFFINRKLKYNATDGTLQFIDTTKNLAQGSNLTVQFPSTYQNSLTNQKCVNINFASSSSSSLCHNPVCIINGNSISITNCTSTQIVADNVTIVISDIQNPSPAIEVGPFLVSLGQDITTTASSNPRPYFTLEAGTLIGSINFNSATINSTSTMTVSIIPTNSVPSIGSSIEVIFPSNWINAVGNAPIRVSTPTCTDTAGLRILSCIWTNSNLVTINISGSSQNITSNFTFTITNIRSPPTTEPSNMLTLTTLTNGNIIDTNTAYVSGLIPKTMTNVYSTSTQNIVNTNFTLSFGIFTIQSFNTIGTTIEITFPSGSIISDSPSIQASPLNLSSITKVGLLLTINLSGSNLISPGNLVFGVSTYTAPATTTPTDPIIITIKKNTYPVQTGSFRFTALPSIITGTMAPSLYIINQITRYTFSVTLNDFISTTGCLQFEFPPNVFINYSSCNASGSNVNTTPSCSSSNSSTFRVCNLFTSTVTTPSIINISLNNGVNPVSSQPTSTFSVSSYYFNMVGLVATGKITGFTPFPSSLQANYVTITPSNRKTMVSNINYSIKFNNRNKIPINGRIYIVFPNDIFVTSLTNPNCQATIASGSMITTPCSATTIDTGTNFTLTSLFTTGQIAANTSILITINNIFRNPVSTQLINSFIIKTADSLGYLIDEGLGYQPIIIPGDLILTSAIQQLNRTNSAISTYTFLLSQLSPFSSNSQVEIIFPSTITPQIPISCADQSSINFPCILLNSVVLVNLSSTVKNTGFTIVVSNIKNAPSLSTSSAFKIVTKISTGALYAENTNTTIANINPSKFSINSSFNHQTLATQTSLLLSFSPTYSIIDYLKINFPSGFTITGLNCDSFTFTGTCTNTSTVGQLIIRGDFVSSAMSLTISGFISPSEPIPQYITISSFDASNYLIDQNLQSIAFTTNCTFPCNTCLGSKTNCTSCYTTLPSVSQIYFFNNTCSAQCQIGYFGNSSDYKCYACQVSCRTCVGANNNCTDCNPNSDYPYLQTSTPLGSCVNKCNSTSFPNNNSYPVKCAACQSPCFTCTSSKQCLSCASNQGYFFNKSCYSSCPQLISIPNEGNKSCILCQTPCATCQTTINTCLSCVQNYFLNETSCNQCLSPKIVYDNNCVSCSSSCATCNGNPSNCTSCQSKVLYNNQCVNTCPSNYAIINGVCQKCNENCKTCSGSVNNCSSCDSMYLVPSFGTCVTSCPENLFLNPSDNTCIQCTSPCFTCTGTASTCSSCRSGYYFLANQCVEQCPNGTSSNGTHCVANSGGGGSGGGSTINNTLNAKVFPLPFTIGGTIALITSGVSKFQNPLTFFSGAVFSLLGLLEWGAYITFLILYIYTYLQINTVFIVIIAILSILYIINIISLVVYFSVLKKDKQFKTWYERKCSSRTITIIGYIVCGLMTFKFMNIIFCRLFSFYLFKAKLESVQKLFGFNFVIFLSAPNTLGTIAIAAYVAYHLSGSTMSQLYLQAIDLIIVSIFTCIFGVATSHVHPTFFEEIDQPNGGKGNDSDYLSGIDQPLNKNQIKQQGSSLHKYMSEVEQQPSLMQIRPDQILTNQFFIENNVGDENYLKNKKKLNKQKSGINGKGIQQIQDPDKIINEQNQNSNSSRNSKKRRRRNKNKNSEQNVIFVEGFNNKSTENNEIIENDALKQQKLLQSDNYLNTEQHDVEIYPLDADKDKYKKIIENENQKNKKQKENQQKGDGKQGSDEQRKNINFTLGKFDENLDISDIDKNGKGDLNDESDISQLQRLDKAEAATRKTKNGQDTSNQYLTDNPLKQFLGSDQESDFKFGTKSHRQGRKKRIIGQNGQEILEDDEDQNRKNNGPEEINQIDDSLPEDPLDIQHHPYHVIKKNKRLPTDPTYRTLQIGDDNKDKNLLSKSKPSQLQSNVRKSQNKNNKNHLPSDQSDQKINELKLRYNNEEGEEGQRGLNKSPTNDPLKLGQRQKKQRNQLLASSSEYTQKQYDDNQTFRNQIMIKPTSQLDLIELTKQEDDRRKLKKQPKKFKVVYDTSGVLDQNEIEFEEIGVSPSDFNHYNQRFIDEQFESNAPRVPFSKNDVPEKPKVVMMKSKNLLDKQLYSYDGMPTNKQMHSRKQSSIQQQPSIGQIIFKPTSAVDRSKRGFSSHMGQRSKNNGFTQRQNKRQKTLQHTDNTAQFYLQKPPPKNNKQLQKIYLQRLVGPYKSRSTIGKSDSKLI